MTTTRRLDTLALRTLNKSMKQNKQVQRLIQNTPYYKDFVETVRKEIKRRHSQRLSAKKDELTSVFYGFLHLKLIQSLMMLFSQEPGCLVVFHFPRRHMNIELYTDRDDQNRLFYLVDIVKNDALHRQMSFWEKDEFVSYLMGLLKENLPKTISVWRSSVSVSETPLHVWIQLVIDAFGETKVSPKMVRLYNQV